MQKPTHAVEAIILSIVAFSLLPMMDAVGKYLTRDYHVLQIIWGRFFFQAMILSAAVFSRRPISILRTRNAGLQTVRAISGWVSTIPFISALVFIPLADAVAALMVGPVIVTALSVPILKEKVGFRRWCAVGLGLTGALIVVRPGLGLMHWAISLPLLAAVLFALFQVLTRRLSATEDRDATLLFGSYGAAALSSVALPFVWKSPDLQGWGFMILTGALFAGAQLTIVRSLHLAPASLLAPFAYVHVIGAIIIGFTVFGEFPDFWTLFGAAAICVSGIYIAVRERKRLEARLET